MHKVLALVGALSARTGVAAPELVKAFGHHLLTRFTQGHGECGVVDDAAARNVGERGGGLHQRQLGRTDPARYQSQ